MVLFCAACTKSTEKWQASFASSPPSGKIFQAVRRDTGKFVGCWDLRSSYARFDPLFRLPAFFYWAPDTMGECYIDGYYYGLPLDTQLDSCDTELIIPAVLELIRNYATNSRHKAAFLGHRIGENPPKEEEYFLASLALYYAYRIYKQDNWMLVDLFYSPKNLTEEELNLLLPYFHNFADALEQVKNVEDAYELGLSPFTEMPENVRELLCGKREISELIKSWFLLPKKTSK